MKLITLTLTVCLGIPVLAQDPSKDFTPKFYRLDFVVKELDESKVVNSKTYTTFATSDEKARSVCSIRAGNRVPYRVSAGPGPSNFQYADVGVNIDCGGPARDWNGQLMLSVLAEISSVPVGEEAGPNNPPTVRQNKWNSTVVVPVGRATTLFSSDDLNSKRKMQLELTAIAVK